MEGAATVSSITSALTTGLTTTANEMLGAISSILPVTLTVVGAILVVTLGIKVFKKFTK